MIESEVHGADSMIISIRAQNAKIRDDIQDILKNASDIAEKYMLANVPRGETHRLAGSIKRGAIVYSPGGAGGGGSYEIEVSAGDEETFEYLPSVVEGSGLYGSKGNYIYASKGNLMVIQKEGEEPRFRWWTRGQKPQSDWIETANKLANEYVAARTRELDLSIR